MQRYSLVLLAALLVLSAPSPSRAADPPADASPIVAIDDALRNRDYPAAIERIDAALAGSDAPDREELLFRRGLALFYAKRPTEALAQFATQLREFPNGAWAAKARFRQADAHVALRQFDAAEAIYDEQATRLVGAERKSRITGVYLDFAREYFQPKDPLIKPDFAKARTFYERALELEPGDALRDEILFQLAVCNQRLDQFQEAANQYHAYLTVYSPEYRKLAAVRNAGAPLPPAASATGKHVLAAQFGLSECRLRLSQMSEARRALQDLLTFVDAPDRAADAESAALRVQARFALSRTYGIPMPPDANALTLGVQALEALIKLAPTSKEAVQAAFDIAASYAHLGRHDDAIAAYRALIDRAAIRPGDDASKLADSLTQDAVFAVGRLFFQQKKYADAIGAWNQYVARYPTGPHWSASQQSILDAEYQIGADAITAKNYDAGKAAWEAFLQKYPLDRRAASILGTFADLARTAALEKEKAGEKPEWAEVISLYRKVVSKYPGSEDAGRAQYMIGNIYETQLKQLEEAIDEYARLNWSGHAATARERLSDLRATRLSAMVERTFRTDETARVRVDVRNVDMLTVKLYRIDMQDYFRKRQCFTGIESLDLVLIDPDKTLSIDVKEYGKYKPITQQIEIPFDGPGVWAVNISNESSKLANSAGISHQKLEATALLIRSDIDTIVKSSRRQMLVFAQNMRTQQPAAGVEVLVAGLVRPPADRAAAAAGAAPTQRVFLTGKTGPDGVWLASADELKDAGDIVVFTNVDGHVAGTAISLQGMGFSTGLTPRGYLHTDRPAYRPGEAVHIRGILREVKDGQYTLPALPSDPRLAWKLDVIDAKGRAVKSQTVSLSPEFGTFAAHYQIAVDAPVGGYKLIARRADGPTFTGEFIVQNFVVPQAYLTFEFDQGIVMRGEKICGSIIARYHYGEPVADKAVEYVMHMPSGEQIQFSGVTGKDGRIKVEFDTTSMPEESRAVFAARQADLAIETTASVFVAVRAFRAEVSTPRPLYLSDEPVEVAVSTRNLKGEPITQAMKVTALLRIQSGSEWSESRIETSDLTTDAETGRARASFKLAKGGSYILRAEGKDRFGHIVSAEATVQVSDEEDATRLRIFTEKQTYRVGDKIAVDVHSRVKPRAADSASSRLALVTFEGEEVIGYRTIEIKPGRNALELPIENRHFPNFAIGVALMAENKFHSAARDIQVERQLNVKLTPSATTLQPREELAVDILVTDQQGNPAAAEIGLVMVDNALLSRFPDKTPDIREFFQTGARRVASLATQTSCTFAHQAQTRPIVSEVLVEVQRAAEAQDFLDSITNAAPGSPPAQPASQPGVFGGGGAGGAGNERSRREVRRATGQAVGRDMQSIQLYQMQQLRDSADELVELGESVAAIDGEPRGEAEKDRGDSSLRAGLLLLDVLSKSEADVAKYSHAFDKALSSLVNAAPPRSYFPDVAYWNPRIVTDETGKATIRITTPDSSTKWKLVARGVSKDTLVGSAESEVISKHDFFVEMLTPPNLVEGGAFTPSARMHCLVPFSGKVRLSIRAVSGDEADGAVVHESAEEVSFDAAGVHDVQFRPISVAASDLKIEVQAEMLDARPAGAAPLRDRVVSTISVRPWGMRIEEHAAGIRGDTDFVEIELPAPPRPEMGEYHDVRMQVAVGSSMPRWLIEEGLESGPRWDAIERSFSALRIAPPRSHADTAAALIGALYAAGYVRSVHSAVAATSDKPLSADARLLEERIAALIAQLLSVQNDDGGWPWGGTGTASDPWITSQVAWALGKAVRDGHGVADAARQKLADFLQKSFAAAGSEQTELKSITLLGLAWLGDVDFAHINRLHRNRDSLSSAALAHLALACVRLDRLSIAAELLGTLEHRLKDWKRGAAVGKCLPSSGSSAWMNSELEVTSLALLAQLAVDPRSANIRPMVDYLAGAARADGWRPHKARGAVLAALSSYYGSAPRDTAAYTLTVSVNGREYRKITPDDAGSLWLDIPSADLKAGKQRVDFAFAGRGEYAFAVTLSGFSKEFPKPIGRAGEPVWADTRWYAPPSQTYKGRVVESGFGVCSRRNWYVNRASKVPLGSVIPVRVNLGRHDNNGENPAGDRDYVIVQETIPAGFRLLTESLAGNFAAYDYSDNLLTLYYGARHDLGQIYYKLVAVTPGTYRVPPTVIRSLYRPEQFNVNRPDELTVIPRGGASDDAFRMTPDELYHLARLHFDDADFETSNRLLRELLAARDWALTDEPYRESVRMLLTCSLRRDDAEGVVDYFEILKEKYPDLVIPFEQIVQIARAYGRTKQHERAYLVYRATADASFARDTAVGGVLQGEGRFLEGIDFLTGVWREHPDTPQVESIYFAFSQSMYAQADKAAALVQRRAVRGNDALPARVSRTDVLRETIAMLDRFLALYPESPIADEASYSMANAYLDLNQFETALKQADQMVALFPKSKWRDRFRYIQALAQFNLGNFKEAELLAQQVADSTFVDDSGIERPSANKWLALYIMGQIYHAQGQTARALEFYKKVRDQFSDAAEAAAVFEHRFVRLPEVTIFHPDGTGFRESVEWARFLRGSGPRADAARQPRDTGSGTVALASHQDSGRSAPSAPLYAKPFVELGHRNLKSAVLQVYRVDLMKLALVEKDLSQITSVNLSGIKPALERTVSLGDGLDFVDKSLRVELDLLDAADAKSPGGAKPAVGGAYLVICRGDDLFSSGLVLVTPLALDVQEDRQAGRVRVSVVDAITRGSLKSVHVKVIGTGMSRFVAGDSDLRGVFVADGVSGYPTAIARDTIGDFAFFRSEGAMLAAAQLRDPDEPKPRQAEGRVAPGKADYSGNLQLDNRWIQNQNDARLQEIYKKQSKGVEVQQAK